MHESYPRNGEDAGPELGKLVLNLLARFVVRVRGLACRCPIRKAEMA